MLFSFERDPSLGRPDSRCTDDLVRPPADQQGDHTPLTHQADTNQV